MGEEADADWQAGLVEWGIADTKVPEVRTRRFRRARCVECGQHYADLPSLRCVGCDAYREHTGHF